ncbi:hypothetical protein [Rhizobium sp. CECT 9324]|uniref:hypothetical protein n=1 Tax=Rhizobium sp. CECT 9324 TaxID=2845820 RepID=UPI001E3524F5|nr:hypothetical protein [Rhizobium sp. CECT 9324]
MLILESWRLFTIHALAGRINSLWVFAYKTKSADFAAGLRLSFRVALHRLYDDLAKIPFVAF